MQVQNGIQKVVQHELSQRKLVHVIVKCVSTKPQLRDQIIPVLNSAHGYTGANSHRRTPYGN